MPAKKLQDENKKKPSAVKKTAVAKTKPKQDNPFATEDSMQENT